MPVEFKAVPLNNTSLTIPDRETLLTLQYEMAILIWVVQETQHYMNEPAKKLTTMMQAVHQTPEASPEPKARIHQLSHKVDDIRYAITGKTPKANREKNPPAQVSTIERLGNIINACFGSTSAPTSTHRHSYEIILDEFPPHNPQLKHISEVELPAIEAEMEKAGVSYTQGRLPE